MGKGDHESAYALTGKGDHGSAGPQYVHASRVSITERRVQAYISQLTTSHMLLFGRHRAEDDSALLDAALGTVL